MEQPQKLSLCLYAPHVPWHTAYWEDNGKLLPLSTLVLNLEHKIISTYTLSYSSINEKCPANDVKLCTCFTVG